jgi:hypothetical protein
VPLRVQARRMVENLLVVVPEQRWTAAQCLDTPPLQATAAAQFNDIPQDDGLP